MSDSCTGCAYDNVDTCSSVSGCVRLKSGPKTADIKVDNKEIEKEYLDKLVNAHWAYINGIFDAIPLMLEEDIKMVEYHYKTAFKHGWGHAREYHVGETL